MKRFLIAGVMLLVIGCGSGADPTATTTTLESTTTTPETTVTTAAPTTTSVPDPTTATTQPTTTTSTSTSTSTTSATTTPTTQEVLSPSGFWKVRIGETVVENEARMGVPFADAGGDPNFCMVLQLPEVGGIHFIAATLTGESVDGRGELVVGRVSADQPGWLTENGIEVGMSVAEAEAILGDTITAREPHAYVDGEYIIVGPEDGRYVFETDGETITAIHAGIEPVVSYIEGCS